MRVEGGKLMAGLLSGLAAGAEIEIFDAAAGGALAGHGATLTAVDADRGRLALRRALPRHRLCRAARPRRPAAAAAGAAGGGRWRRLRRGAGDARPYPRGRAGRRAGLGRRRLRHAAGAGGRRDRASSAATACSTRDGPGSSPRIPADAGADVILGFIDRAVRLHRLQAALAAAEGRKGGFGLGPAPGCRSRPSGCAAAGPAATAPSPRASRARWPTAAR